MRTEAQRLITLVAALNEREQAKSVSSPEDNPFAKATLADIAGRQEFPAINMVTKVKTTGENKDVEDEADSVAYHMEAARFEARAKGRADKSAKRMAQAKARAQRKVEFDKIANSKVKPSPERLERAWLIVFHMVGIVGRIAKSKQRWANRLLGSSADDIPQITLEHMALVLAKQTKFDLDVLVQAAKELGQHEAGIPGDQTVDENDPDERRKVRKARKWLMGMANNRVMGALVDSYMDQKNLKWDNIDLIATVMASINGPGDDAMLARFKADRAPAFLGTRFQRPGGINADVMAMAISAAITERGLDPMVEFMLNEEARRVDGSMKWSEHAEAIFMLTPNGDGEWMWDAVKQATEGLSHARKARGDAARKHVRNLFGFLPDVIVGVVEASDPHFIGWSSRGRRAVMASDFELFYQGDVPEIRQVLQPKLAYGTPKEAARALIEHLALLTSGKDMIQ